MSPTDASKQPAMEKQEQQEKPELPLVSICSQILNQCEWAREMIQSVIASTYENWELLIVDDGSTEDLKGVIESFKDPRIQYFRFEETKCVPAGLNFLFPKTRGKYLCILAADEWITKDKMAEQVAYMEQHPGVDAVWGLPGSGETAPPGGWPMGPRPEHEQYALRAHNRSRAAWLRTLVQLEGVPIGSCSMMMKKSVMDDLKGMTPHLRIFTDHELFCRFFEKYVGVILPYRWAMDKPCHENSIRVKNLHRAKEEITYVVEHHPIPVPPADGTITVGIPCYNHAKYLKDSIGSVLAQTRPVDEIIVLNDGSTDDFNTVIQQFTDPRIRVMAFDENRGIDEAANQMAFRAKGDFFVFMAADDIMHPQYVEKCLKEFAAHPWTELVASQTGFIDAEGREFNTVENPMIKIPQVKNRTREEHLAAMHPGNHYFGIGMYRTMALSEVGGWEKQYKVISDYQLYLKLLQRENIRIVEEPLTITRVTGDNKSLLTGKDAMELPHLYHAARKPFYRKMMKVMIATPFYELKGFSPYIRTLCETLRLLQAVGIDYHFQELSGDSYVHRARNTLCDLFLRDPDFTDLFFIDSDMSWNPDAFVKMCMLPDDVIGAAYPVKNKWDAWTSIPKFHHSDGQVHLQGRNLGDGTALVEAQVLAGGFLRIKRAALEKFRDHYPDEWYEEPTTDPAQPNHRYTKFFGAESIDHKFYGEDHMFSKRLRDAGIRMFIYPDVDIIHWGYKDFAGNFDKFLKREKFAENARQVLPQAA